MYFVIVVSHNRSQIYTDRQLETCRWTMSNHESHVPSSGLVSN